MTTQATPNECYEDHALRMSTAGDGGGSCIQKIVGLTGSCTAGQTSTYLSPAGGATKCTGNGFEKVTISSIKTDKNSFITTDNSEIDVYGNKNAAIKFIPTESYTLSVVSLTLAKVGNPGDIAFYDIYTDVSGHPGVSIASRGFNPSAVSGTPVEIIVDLSSFNTSLTAGTPYWIGLSNSSGSAGNYLMWYAKAGHDTVDGSLSYCLDITSPSWVEENSNGLFKIDGAPHGIKFNHTFVATGTQSLSGFMLANADSNRDMYECCFATPFPMENGDSISLQVTLNYILGT
jgi:hypothetical protein